MKYILTPLILLFLAYSSFAQGLNVKKSESFEMPQEGMFRILQMKNGNTLLFQFVLKEGMYITIFDSTGKIKTTRNYGGTIWTLKSLKPADIDGVYEIGGEAVVFMNTREEKVPKLYRVRVNPDNGSVIEEKNMLELPELQGLRFYQRMAMKYMTVSKDPNSDAYAVMSYTNMLKEGEKNRVYLFNGKHELVNQADINVVEDKNYVAWSFKGMVVNGEKDVCVAMYADTRAHSGVPHKLSVFRMSGKEPDVAVNDIELGRDHESKIWMTRNSANNTLEILTQNTTDVKSNQFTHVVTVFYNLKLFVMDEETLHNNSSRLIDIEEIENGLSQKRNKDIVFHGDPTGLVVNAEGDGSILFEESALETNHRSSFGSIGIMDISDVGRGQGGHSILKKQIAPISLRYGGNVLDRYKSIPKSDFYSFNYFENPKGRFVFYNDLEDNVTDVQARSVSPLKDYRDAQPAYLNLKSGNPALLFQPEPHTYRQIIIDAGNYNNNTGCYATVMMERKRNQTSACLIWVN